MKLVHTFSNKIKTANEKAAPVPLCSKLYFGIIMADP